MAYLLTFCIVLVLVLLLPLGLMFILFRQFSNGNTQRSLNILKSSKVPNATGSLPIIGCLLVLRTIKPDNLHLKFKEFILRFGKSFYANVFGVIVVVTAESRFVDALLGSQQNVRKNVLYNMLRSWLGNGLLLSSGSDWYKMRKIITPTFHFRILEQFVDVFQRQSCVLVTKLKAYANGEEIVDIYPLLGLATLDIITETAMGVSMNAQLGAKSDMVQAIKDVTNVLATRFVRPHLIVRTMFRLFWPLGYLKEAAGVKLMHEFTNNIIERRRRHLLMQHQQQQQPSLETEMKPMALLDVLLQSTINGIPLTDKQIRDEVSTFIFEGHDTTTSATSFCLYLISRHANVQDRLFNELYGHFGDDLSRSICYADLHELSYLNCVVREALRLYPPIPAIGRWLKDDLTLDNDEALPAGANVVILLWEILRDPDVFEAPEEFRPERHLEQNPRANAYSNIPFSAGPRNCIGQRFALLEVKTLVVTILRHYELLPMGSDIQPSIKIVLRSKTGVNVGLKMRKYK